MSPRDFGKETTASAYFAEAVKCFRAASKTGDEIWAALAECALKNAVAKFGYELRPITTPQQDADACLARRVAEDGRDGGRMNINSIGADDRT